MKALLWFGFLMLFTASAQAGNFYTPLLCPAEEASLKVVNSSSEAQSFWFQNLGSAPFSEAYVEVKAGGVLHLPLQEYYTNKQTAIAVKTQNDSLRFQAFCKTQSLEWSLDGNSSPWKLLSLPPQNAKIRLHLVNLSQQTNSLEILFETSLGVVSSQGLTLSEDFQTQVLELTPPFGTIALRLQAQGRWIGKVFSPQNQEWLLQEETLVLASVPAQRYFLFESAFHDNSESFVVPMENPKLIAESLAQIAAPDQARLLVARIEKSQSSLNRDFSSANKSPWSWQVVKAQNYADFAHIGCDGTPALVEERLNSWLQETGGTICFWSYRVIRELSPQELQQNPLASWLPALGIPLRKR